MATKKTPTDKLRDIRTDLSVAFIELFGLFAREYPSADIATEHLQINSIEFSLNRLKSLEFLYRDNGQNGRVKKNYPRELKQALRLLNKYSENSEVGNPYSDLVLKEKYDKTGQIAQRNSLKNRTRKK